MGFAPHGVLSRPCVCEDFPSLGLSRRAALRCRRCAQPRSSAPSHQLRGLTPLLVPLVPLPAEAPRRRRRCHLQRGRPLGLHRKRSRASVRTVVRKAYAGTVAALASASTVVEEANAGTVAALAFASTVVRKASARTVAALASASTVVEEASARTVAALAFASTVVEEANAGTVAALASASTVVEEANAGTVAASTRPCDLGVMICPPN